MEQPAGQAGNGHGLIAPLLLPPSLPVCSEGMPRVVSPPPKVFLPLLSGFSFVGDDVDDWNSNQG